MESKSQTIYTHNTGLVPITHDLTHFLPNGGGARGILKPFHENNMQNLF
jgi:hypothetical protein